MANRAINSAGSTPAGYDSGHTTLNAALAASANSDDERWTEGFTTNEAINTTLTDIDIGVDNQTGTGVADIAHTGSAVWDTSRAGIINSNTVLRANAGVVRVEWMQTHTTGISGANNYFSTTGSGMICKNCLAWSDGRSGVGFGIRTQTTVSEADSTIECHYCIVVLNNHVTGGGYGFRCWNHSTGFVPTGTASNCTVIGLTDAVKLGINFNVLGAQAAQLTFTNCQLYGAVAGTANNSNPFVDAGDGGAGHNASTFDEPTLQPTKIDLGTDFYPSDTITDWVTDPTGGVGADLTPIFFARRLGTDNSANAAQNDAGDPVDFRKTLILTLNIGAWDEGIAPTVEGGDPLIYARGSRPRRSKRYNRPNYRGVKIH